MKVYVDELPKSCYECKLCKIKTQVEFVGYTTNSYKCLLNGSMLTNNCPLQSLADHDNKDKRISELEKQLADVKNSCDYYMKRSNDLVLKLAEKDKLIGVYADEHAMLQCKIADLVVKEIKTEDFAIEQLEKVKKYADIDFRKNCYIDAVGLDKFIDNQIEELKKEIK